jgi:GntP family gluconate:H+ symporter
MAVVVGGVLFLRLHAFLALILGALVVALLTPDESLRQYVTGEVAAGAMSEKAGESLLQQTVGERIAVSFGGTCTQIAILIAMAAIIGKCLLDSGAAERVVTATRNALGDQRTPLAFVVSGFVVGIPVFFDTVFYLLIPLGKAMRARTGRNYLLYVLSIVAGATMAHSLVPPTPGPLFVAEKLGVNIGNMILGGLVVGVFTIFYGYLHAAVVNRLASVPVRESADMSLADLQRLSDRDESQLPALWLSLVPVVLPVLLISGYAISKPYLPQPGAADVAAWQVTAGYWIETLGNKNIALIVAAAIALVTLAWQRKTSREEMATAVQSALAGGGVIILITAGGGVFGGMLRQTGIGYWLQQQELAPTSAVSILVMAFFLTTLVRTAQGSATVAMITAVGIIGPLVDPESMGFDPVYVALAIGCGSKPISWMNDSGFWVISKMSGLTETETLTYVTPMTALMGLVGLLATLAGAMWWPLPFGG